MFALFKSEISYFCKTWKDLKLSIMCTLALKEWSLEQQWGTSWEMVGNAVSGPTQTSRVSISIAMRSPSPRWFLYVKIGETLYSWTFAVLTSQKCLRAPNPVPLSFTLDPILVFSLTNTTSTFKHDTISLYCSPFPYQYSSFLGFCLALFFLS